MGWHMQGVQTGITRIYDLQSTKNWEHGNRLNGSTLVMIRSRGSVESMSRMKVEHICSIHQGGHILRIMHTQCEKGISQSWYIVLLGTETSFYSSASV